MHNQKKFKDRVRKHSRFQKEMQDRLRYLSKRKHTPDWVQAIGGRLVLLDTKTTPNVEDNSIHEYQRCVYEDAMPVVIIFMNWDETVRDMCPECKKYLSLSQVVFDNAKALRLKGDRVLTIATESQVKLYQQASRLEGLF